MSTTTTYGYKRPVNGDRGSVWFADLITNIDRMDAHDHDGVDSALLPAANIVNTPAGNLSSATVQAALNELQGDIDTINTSVSGLSTLADGKIYVGNGSNVATEVTMSGDVTITNAGVSAIGSGVIVNDDINASAGIAYSKLAAATASRALVSDASGFVTAATTTSTEIGYVNGVTSAIQTQINAKAPSASPTFTGTVTTPLTASRAVVLGASSELAASATTATEIGYVSGVTSAIQTQINAKAPSASPTFTGTITTPLTASRAVVLGASNELVAATTTATEIGYVNGVTSAIQTQLNAKAPSASPTFTGTVTTPLTASRAVVLGASSELVAATTTATEIGYVNGVTSAIQTQLDGKISNTLTTTTGDMIYASGANTPARLPIGSSGQILKTQGGIPTWATFSGGINYLASNPDAEANAITGWATFADAAASTPADGTGGSPNSTWTATSTTPLRGTYSFLWTKSSGASRQGEGVSYDFTIDAADKGMALQISFDYIVSSGTYVDNAMQVWIYDVTNTTMIQPAPTNILNTSVSARWNGTFQTSSSSTSYRLILYVPVTTDSANTLRFDNFYLGPQKVSMGPAVSDFQSYTPTGSWVSNTTYSGYWRRVGDSVHVIARVAVSGGAPTAATLTIGLPSGLTIDTAKLPSTSTNSGAFGAARIYDSGTAQYAGTVMYQNTTTVTVSYQGTGSLGWVTNTAPMSFTTGDEVDVEFMVPITGWSSSTILSSDADTRVVAARITGASTCTGTVATTFAGSSAITWDAAAAIDTHGCWNGTTTWTVPSPGIYQISARVIQSGTEAANDTVQLALAVNGVQSLTGYDRIQASGLTAFSTNVFGNVALVAGDALTMRLISATGTPTLATASAVFWSINKLSGPSQIAASETVNFATEGGTLTGTVNTTFGTATDITWSSPALHDSHGGFNGTTTYTVQSGGMYRVHALIRVTGTEAVNDTVDLVLNKSGSAYNRFGRTYVTATSLTATVITSDITLRCVAGDTLAWRCVTAMTAAALSASSSICWFEVTKVGN